MKRAQYGIDAPGLVLGFLVTGVVFGAAGSGVVHWVRGWAVWVAGILFGVSLYGLGMCGYMLWWSLITKVRGRDAILDLVKWTGEERVLDVGCGRGLLLVGAARRLRSGEATGIDLWVDKDQTGNERGAPLENARREGVADRVRVETGDMRELPFAESAFDVVVSSWAVHNLEEPADRMRAVAEMVRVVRSGGVVLLNDIAHREEYAAEFKRLGMRDVRLEVASKVRDGVNRLVSFGSFGPATVMARKV